MYMYIYIFFFSFTCFFRHVRREITVEKESKFQWLSKNRCVRNVGRRAIRFTDT